MFQNTFKFLALVAFLKNNIKCDINLQEDDTIVQLPNGKIRGHILETNTGRQYYAFQEIPYATPPVGELRFKAPVPPQNWEGILDTTNNTKICYQFGGYPDIINSTRENEDCLYLNVYTPEVGRIEKPRPVLIYIHGGSYFCNDGTFESLGPEFFINYGLVVVTINYRLGPLGFLSTEDGVIPGNIGLRDQSLAMKWVSDNIHLFGGDPWRITISGESAGAASVGYHLLSRKSSGLFSAAISQSGSPLCPWSLQRDASKHAYQWASDLNPEFNRSSTTEELLKFLQDQPIEHLKFTSVSVNSTYQLGVASDTWVPVIEDADNPDTFITSAMHESFRKGDFNRVPVLIGINSEEALYYAADLDSFKNMMAFYDNDLPLVVNKDFHVNDSDLVNVGAAIRKIYTNGLFQDDLGASIKLMSDVFITTGSLRQADLSSQYANIYYYQISYAGELGDNNDYQVDGAERVQHAKEQNYFWRVERNSDLSKFSEEDLLVQKRLLTLWSNFVTYFNPTPFEDTLLNNVTWSTVSPINFTYLNINSTLEVKTSPRYYQELKSIVDTYGNPPFDTY